MFNQLLQCNTLNEIERFREKHGHKLPTHALGYLARVNNVAQYPGARCGMGDDVCMYGRTASSGNESMNRANKCARERYGVDLIVASMIMIKLAATRFENKKAVAWLERDTILTRKGLEIKNECFRNIHLRNYQYQVQEMNDWWMFTVTDRSGDEAMQYIVKISKDAGTHGSRFGSCTCGRPKLLGVPCAHMVIAVKTGRVQQLKEENVMPYWWHTQQMRLQYPRLLEFVGDMDMSMLKNMGMPSPHLYYCPEIAGARKTGRPKNASRIVGVLEAAGRGRGRGRGGGRGRGRGVVGGSVGRGCGRGRGRGGVGDKGDDPNFDVEGNGVGNHDGAAGIV